MNVALIGAAALLLAGSYLYARRLADDAAMLDGTDWTDQAGAALDNFAASVAQVFVSGAMGKVTRADVAHPNVQAFLMVIRRGEGTSDPDGYRRIFGGALFTSFADHPRIKKTATFKNGKTVTSTAAGAYQFLASTWDETARALALGDFSPAAQDWAAVARIAARGALADVQAGRFDVAIQKVAKEWASLPGSPYGQPTISLAMAQTTYTAHGGQFA